MGGDEIYNEWEMICEEIVSTENKNWKQHPHVFNMLEHVPYWIGKQYLENLVNKENIDVHLVQEISNLNDTDGSNLAEYEIENQKIKISPTTLRYLSHSIDIIKLLKNNNVSIISIVEIGAGYGGLALVFNYLSCKQKYSLKVKKYYIYDLPSVQNLQEYYLGRHDFLDGIVEWKDCFSYGTDLKDENIFLISNYSLSEMKLEYRKKYLYNILPNIMGSYMVWNSTNMEGLPFKRIEKDEDPKTGDNNKVIIII